MKSRAAIKSIEQRRGRVLVNERCQPGMRADLTAFGEELVGGLVEVGAWELTVFSRDAWREERVRGPVGNQRGVTLPVFGEADNCDSLRKNLARSEQCHHQRETKARRRLAADCAR